MATMTISLPEAMKDWVEGRAADGSFEDTSDYLRGLIQRDQDLQKWIVETQKLLDEGFASGVSTRSMEDIRSAARANLRLGAADDV